MKTTITIAFFDGYGRTMDKPKIAARDETDIAAAMHIGRKEAEDTVSENGFPMLSAGVIVEVTVPETGTCERKFGDRRGDGGEHIAWRR